MTRRSKREIERALEELDDSSRREGHAPRLRERYPDGVVRVIHGTARGLFGICHRNPERIANAPEPEATEAFLDVVRSEYGIETDRDEAVRRWLAAAAANHPHMSPPDAFATATLTVAAEQDLSASTGESFEALVDAGREQDAAQLLVQTAYEALADEGGRRSEVPA